MKSSGAALQNRVHSIDYMELIINVLEVFLYISGFCFIISTCILVRSVKKSNYNLVKNAVTNPFFPNIDLSFFSKLQNECKKNNKNKIFVIVNKISFYFSTIGFIVFFIMIIAQDFLAASRIFPQ